MAAFFMREVVWQLVGARTWRARQVLCDTCEPDLSERAPHVAPLQKKALSSWDSAFFYPLEASIIRYHIIMEGITMDEREWEQLLHIKTAGHDDSHSDGEHHPYEPTDYGVLERLANSGYIGKKDTLIDYGSGKGRVSFFLAYQTRCQAIGVEYDRRLWEKALANGQTAASRRRVTFVLADAVEYEVPPEGTCFFFFNPFALHTLKRVLGKLFDAHYQAPRPMRLFFYYPYEETEAFLTHHPNLVVEDVIDCRDLFDEDDDREKILVLRLRD
jgi:hypothetical protein